MVGWLVGYLTWCLYSIEEIEDGDRGKSESRVCKSAMYQPKQWESYGDSTRFIVVVVVAGAGAAVVVAVVVVVLSTGRPVIAFSLPSLECLQSVLGWVFVLLCFVSFRFVLFFVLLCFVCFAWLGLAMFCFVLFLFLCFCCCSSSCFCCSECHSRTYSPLIFTNICLYQSLSGWPCSVW